MLVPQYLKLPIAGIIWLESYFEKAAFTG